MNLKNMKKLRAALRSRKNLVKFDMASWFAHNDVVKTTRGDVLSIVKEHPCGTVACLAGHAAILAWQEGDLSVPEYWEGNPIFQAARKFLGLTGSQADHLFYGYWSPIRERKGISKIPKTHAIKELTRLIEAETS